MVNKLSIGQIEDIPRSYGTVFKVLPSVGHDPTVLSFVSDEFTIQLIQIKVSDSQSSPSNALLNES